MKIFNRFTGDLILEIEGANLRGANLIDANLKGANLRDANLMCANLIGANLRHCSGDREYIRSIFISEAYPITYTSEVMQIGCERHQLEDWWGFDDNRILQMDAKTALKFWREHKELIKQIIDKCPAKQTKGGAE